MHNKLYRWDKEFTRPFAFLSKWVWLVRLTYCLPAYMGRISKGDYFTVNKIRSMLLPQNQNAGANPPYSKLESAWCTYHLIVACGLHAINMNGLAWRHWGNFHTLYQARVHWLNMRGELVVHNRYIFHQCDKWEKWINIKIYMHYIAETLSDKVFLMQILTCKLF